jgi:hypothetical protein
MKSNQKVTRVKLNIEQNNYYILLGLVSAEPDYKLSLTLNKKFGIFLKNIPSLRLSGNNNTEVTFSRYSNNADNEDIIIELVSNRSGKNYLLNKLKNIDYLLQIQISENEAEINDLTTRLREIDTITAVFKIDITTIKDKNLHYLMH